MARKRADEETKETVTTLAGGSPESVDVKAELVANAPVIASAVKEHPKPVAGVRKVRRFRVTKGGMISNHGYRTMVREGKELDDLNYDIRSLATQGIHLEEIQEATPAPVPAGY